MGSDSDAQDPREAELAEVLRDDLEAGFKLIEVYFRKKIQRYIKRVASLENQDLADVYQNTMISFLATLKKGGVDLTRPMALLLHIAGRRAIDFRRGRRSPDALHPNQVLQEILDSNRRGALGRSYRQMNSVERSEFDGAVVRAIDALPPAQRAAAQAFVLTYEDCQGASLRHQPMAQMAGAILGHDVDVAQVKANWQQAKRKIRDYLIKQGFVFVGTQEVRR